MIQRTQTLYLILADIALILLFFFSFASFQQNAPNFICFKLYVYGAKNYIPGTVSPLSLLNALPLLLFNVFIIVLASVAITRFKNRSYQLKLILRAIFFNIVLIAGLLVYIKIIEAKYNVHADCFGQFGIYFPFLSVIFLFLARRGVLKDEKLVKAADRIR